MLHGVAKKKKKKMLFMSVNRKWQMEIVVRRELFSC